MSKKFISPIFESNDYSIKLKNEPFSIKDQAKNILQFLAPVKEENYFNVKYNIFSKNLINNIIYQYENNGFPNIENPTKNDHVMINKIINTLISIVPQTFSQRSLIGITDISCKSMIGLDYAKEDPEFDQDGNKTFINIIIFLYSGICKDGQYSTWILNQQRIPVTDTRNVCVLYDNSYGVTHPFIVSGKQIVLKAKVLYSILPINSLSLSLKEQNIIWRGSMRKTFINTLNFQQNQINSIEVKSDKQDNILEDQCESCLYFISIDSTVCPYCSDKLISIPSIIHSRKKGIWISI